MAQTDPDVKPCGARARFCYWIDHHPRLGWYVAAWAVLVSLESLIDFVDMFLRAVT